MSCFSKSNQDDYVFRFEDKEEQLFLNNNAEPLVALPNDYFFFWDSKHQSLFYQEQVIKPNDHKLVDPFDKCASNKLLRQDNEFDCSFVPIEFKTGNIDLKNLSVHNDAIISEDRNQDFCNTYEINKDCSIDAKERHIQDEDNQTTQVQTNKQGFECRYIGNRDTQTRKRGPRRMKFSRWGKEDDKRLYRDLLSLINQNKISKKFIENIDDVDVVADLKEIKIISSLIKWKNPFIDMIKRIKKILKSKKMSAREVIALKRIVKNKYSSEPIDYNYLMEEFPGKSQETLERECDKIFRRL